MTVIYGDMMLYACTFADESCVFEKPSMQLGMTAFEHVTSPAVKMRYYLAKYWAPRIASEFHREQPSEEFL